MIITIQDIIDVTVTAVIVLGVGLGLIYWWIKYWFKGEKR